MRNIIILFFIYLFVITADSQKSILNLALCIDRIDSNVKTDIKMLTDSCTLVTWVEGNDKSWNNLEVIFGDGEIANSVPLAISVLPEAFGINEGDSMVFGTLLDEVRIWDSASSTETIRECNNKPLSPTHTQFKTLVA